MRYLDFDKVTTSRLFCCVRRSAAWGAAFLARFTAKYQSSLGLVEVQKNIRLEEVRRLVFVCRGNVCRSPYAEAVARSNGLLAMSCGVDVTLSAPAESMAISVADARGLDLSGHMSRSIYNISLSPSDYLLAMDKATFAVARKTASQRGCQIMLLGLYQGSPAPEIRDPYGGSRELFERCFDEIDNAVVRLEGLLDALAKEA